MKLLSRFTFLPKSEPSKQPASKNTSEWTIDVRKFLSSEEITKLRLFCANELEVGIENRNFQKIRNHLIVELGLSAGLRVEEMTKLRHRDIVCDNSRSYMNVNGKGNKIRTVIIGSFLKSIIMQYIHRKGQLGFSTKSDSYLVNNCKDSNISKRSIQKFFKTITTKCDLPKHYSIHCLRHTYTTYLLQSSNYNYEFVRRQLGHSSIRTTQTYAGVIESEGKKAVDNIYK